MSKYTASVIIPTYNRWDSLLRTLESLENQVLPESGYEVIVVNDGSSEKECDYLQRNFKFPFKYIYQTNQGSAIARNTGAEKSRGDVLIFLDDDMIVEPSYVIGLVEEHVRFPKIIGMGTTIPHAPESPTTFQSFYYENSIGEKSLPESIFVEFSDCVTNNLSVGYEDFFEIGGMQDVAGDGPTWWGDVDFGYRAEQLGFRFRRSGKALCSHIDYSYRDLETASQRMESVSYLVVNLFKKYPDLQPRIPMYLDKAPINWTVDTPTMVVRKIVRQISASKIISLGLRRVVILVERWFPRANFLGDLYRWVLGGYMFRGFRAGLKDNGLL